MALLEALTAEEENPVKFAQLRTGELASAGLSNVPARIGFLIGRLGYPGIDQARLTEAWAKQVSQRPDAKRGELLATVRDLSREADLGEGPIGRWRRTLLAALEPSLDSVDTVETFSPNSSKEERQTRLELKTLLSDWPRRLLESREWAYADAPLPDMEPLPLDDVWVELQLLDLEDNDILLDQSSIREALDQRYEDRHWRSLPLELTLERLDHSAVFVGPPGCGKTTLLKWLARRLILQPTCRYLLPLLVPLRTYGTWRRDNPSCDLLDYALLKAGVRDPAQRRLWSGAMTYMIGSEADPVVLLLDGWDEVSPEHQQTVYQEIEHYTNAFTMLVTSRPSGYPRNLPILDIFQISELAPESIDALIYRWFRHIGRPDQAEGLRSQLARNIDLRRMARNPFMLSLICGISWRHRRNKIPELPQSRSDLYESAVALIFNHHDQRYPESPFGSEEQRQVDRLALWLLDEAPGAPRFVFGRDDIAACCPNPQRLERLLLSSRLLSQLGLSDESHHFLHTTLQEFLAARGLARQEPDYILETMSRHVLNVAWLEVLQFLAGQGSFQIRVFWREVARLCKTPDRFGHIFLKMARFAAEASVKNGGTEEIGIDLREKLWQGVAASNASSRFFEALGALDSANLLTRVKNALSGDDHLVKDRCLRNLGRMAGFEASEFLLERLLEANPVDFSEALEQLRLRRNLHPDSLTRLRRATFAEHSDRRRRKSLLRALSEVGDVGSIPDMIKLASYRPEEAGDIPEALGWMGGPQATVALQDMAGWRREDIEWQKQVTKMLGLAGTTGARDFLLQRLALLGEKDLLLPCHLEALGGMPIFHGAHLIKIWLASEDSSEQVRIAAAKALENATEPGTTATLAEAAKQDPSEAVRMAALGSMENKGRNDHIDWLAGRVSDTTRHVEERCLALRVLLKTVERFRCSAYSAGHESRAAAIVVDILATGSEEKLVRTATQLAHLSGESVGAQLAKIATDRGRSVAVRVDACRSLARLRFNAVADDLVKLARQGPESRLRDRRPGPVQPWTEELPFRLMWHGDRVSFALKSVEGKTPEQEVGQAAADALARIDPSRLLDVAGSTADNALSAWALETGSLVFEDHILGPDGQISVWKQGHPLLQEFSQSSSGLPATQLVIRVPNPEDPRRLVFELVPRSVGPVTKRRFRPIKLGREPRYYRQDLIKDIQSYLPSGPEWQAITTHRLRSKGSALFSVLPKKLRSWLAAVRHEPMQLQLISEEVYLPWEILFLSGPGSEPEEAPFLAEAFAVTRWEDRTRQHMSFGLSRVAIIASELGSDSNIHKEVEDLLALLGSSRVELIRPRHQSVRKALSSGTFDAWHFVGHGLSRAEDADRWELALEDGQVLRPEDFRDLPGFGLRCPWVFLNACASGLVGESLTGPSGWALQCLNAGAGIFVGTQWTVPGREAHRFALALYQSFLLGRPLGDAVRFARLQVKKAFPGSPHWLAYTVYGHPGAKVNLENRIPLTT